MVQTARGRSRVMHHTCRAVTRPDLTKPNQTCLQFVQSDTVTSAQDLQVDTIAKLLVLLLVHVLVGVIVHIHVPAWAILRTLCRVGGRSG